jgi:hypothetical protein
MGFLNAQKKPIDDWYISVKHEYHQRMHNGGREKLLNWVEQLISWTTLEKQVDPSFRKHLGTLKFCPVLLIIRVCIIYLFWN